MLTNQLDFHSLQSHVELVSKDYIMGYRISRSFGISSSQAQRNLRTEILELTTLHSVGVNLVLEKNMMLHQMASNGRGHQKWDKACQTNHHFMDNMVIPFLKVLLKVSLVTVGSSLLLQLWLKDQRGLKM